MKINKLKRQLGILSLVASFILLPPLLFTLGVIIWAVITYNGICPGLIDIPAYPCSMWEYIGRNTISPFAFPAHFIVWMAWISFSVGLVALVALVALVGQWLLMRWQARP